jgi:hypothetical protein
VNNFYTSSINHERKREREREIRGRERERERGRERVYIINHHTKKEK